MGDDKNGGIRATLYFEVKIKGLLMNLIWGRE